MKAAQVIQARYVTAGMYLLADSGEFEIVKASTRDTYWQDMTIDLQNGKTVKVYDDVMVVVVR